MCDAEVLEHWMCDMYIYMHKHERLWESGGMLPHKIC